MGTLRVELPEIKRCPTGCSPRCVHEHGKYYVCCDCACVGPERRTARGAIACWNEGLATVSLKRLQGLICRVGAP
jgi:hypothetical protein